MCWVAIAEIIWTYLKNKCFGKCSPIHKTSDYEIGNVEDSFNQSSLNDSYFTFNFVIFQRGPTECEASHICLLKLDLWPEWRSVQNSPLCLDPCISRSTSNAFFSNQNWSCTIRIIIGCKYTITCQERKNIVPWIFSYFLPCFLQVKQACFSSN